MEKWAGGICNCVALPPASAAWTLIAACPRCCSASASLEVVRVSSAAELNRGGKFCGIMDALPRRCLAVAVHCLHARKVWLIVVNGNLQTYHGWQYPSVYASSSSSPAAILKSSTLLPRRTVLYGPMAAPCVITVPRFCRNQEALATKWRTRGGLGGCILSQKAGACRFD